MEVALDLILCCDWDVGTGAGELVPLPLTPPVPPLPPTLATPTVEATAATATPPLPLLVLPGVGVVLGLGC